MADHELTREEVFALAGAFRVDAAKTLLRMVHFPAWAVPESGYANSLDFWSLIAEQVAAGVMADGRSKILSGARDRFPGSKKFAAFAAAAAPPAVPGPSGQAAPSGPAVSVAGSRGVQVGNNNVQINYHAHEPARPAAAADGTARDGTAGDADRTAVLRVLVIGASPIDPDLPHVRADREAHAIETVAVPDRVEVKVVLGAEATDVRHVGSFKPHIVHFVCHGTADSLVFSDTRGEADYVSAARVAERLRFYRDEHGVRLRAVVLAACDGQALAPFFSGVADTVIGHRGKLADQCGVTFAEQFYARLNDAPALTGPVPSAISLAALAREAAQLAAQYSAACDPVIANLIVAPDGG